MKCPHCGQEHPDNYQFCPTTGQPIPKLKACANPECPDFGKPILLPDAKFCGRCGKPIGKEEKEGKRIVVCDAAKPSQIVVVCAEVGASIQIGKFIEEGDIRREKRIRLKKGENIISVEEYPELQHGFSFNKQSDKPEYVEDIVLDKYDTSNVTDMSLMFDGCSSLVSLDLSSFNTSNVTNMYEMFGGCSSLVSLDLSSFNTSNVTDMSWMFWGCSSLKSLNLSVFETSNVTEMYNMFCDCSSLESLDLSCFNTSNVTDMSCMFSECSSLEELDLSGFDTSNVTDMSYMFWNCSSLEELDLSGFDTSNARTKSMFGLCSEVINEEYGYLL